MKKLPIVLFALAAAFLVTAGPARAQSDTPQQIQGLIVSGQDQAALAQLQAVLQAHPDSGVAWYLSAEAQDAQGNEAVARSDLANAQHYAPGLPFAKPDDAAALQAHLDGNTTASGSAPWQQPRHAGFSPGFGGIILLVVLFLVVRMFFRRRRFGADYPAGYGPSPGPYQNGPGFGPGGMGSGIGGSLLGGLAAGAGFAAGERVLGDMFGGNNAQAGNFPQDPNFGNGGMPDRDDGLQGNPGWDSGGGQDDNNFDSGNSW